MRLDNLVKIVGNREKGKRRGRGYASNRGGHTVGFGTKGQKARGRAKVSPGFEGGQVPIYKRLPQLGGFKNPTSIKLRGVSISKLNVFNEGEVVSPISLVQKRILKKMPKDGVKLLGTGVLNKKLGLKDFYYSKKALEIIEKSGSKIND
ncbi:50S ribosomal protein L15 [candidate division WWE3 bacterium RIFOXYC1_FULL_40_10]|uniref:Large ribosomal subunit protein uL15 n=1 Tax=candidate division WWE3 bacterium RIFOXYA2_FULL_46_9 TaxID=1802636 RepID=A0A1F4VYF2_UNCKA|nr:MAG: 50S ribosomal protein L15 [candidate division WWE3 bacterium RIFOXYB1_FULL_40_22]OGC61852.1 MAG: 50S ribosomal protein L15 [candidate division WWE3 bacterium RIFOXYA1_FULL_40_11]OGC62217.1 MAG: 50S ribosomal protein L15 [candidate division WWE3 bacterium RIFOXYA2_FULL_46_9]OGC64324.1 MAG: 50S ribosomal protein L15 [candidate division WWE3 bacterium RIFOXYB2_FULL_41_6]OGC66235.1 MAG: 50S ribosomal protein L15 [candidate division WWE3 bacterium RIFOXYC1_FULL_40_10]OGC67841.1 MAG: 50S rib